MRRLPQTADVCRSAGAEHVEIYPTNLTHGRAVDTLCEHLVKSHHAIDVLVNNAGRMEKTAGTPIDGARAAGPCISSLGLSTPGLKSCLAPASCMRMKAQRLPMRCTSSIRELRETRRVAQTQGIRTTGTKC